MAYLVLARKYRPQSFEDVVGQEHVTRTLQNAIKSERVAHGYLFAGARGVGKTSAARILAKALNCKEGVTPQPCGTCVSCTEVVTGRSMDVIEVDGASNRGIDQIRELRETVRFRPARDRCKVYIIDEVHMLTSEAFNALLKTLEEPPDHVHFIFATTEPQKIPVTILSRCQRFDFKRLSSKALVGHLTAILAAEEIGADEQAMQMLAREAEGSVRDGLSLLDRVIAYGQGDIDGEMVREALGVSDRSAVFSVVEALIQGRSDSALISIDNLAEHGLDLQHFARQLVQLLRDLLVVRVAGADAAPVDMPGSQVEELSNLAQQVSVDALQWMVHRAVARLEEISHSSTPRIALELTVVELARLSSLVGIEHLLRRLEALEKGAPLPVQPPSQRGGSSPDSRHTPPVVEAAPPVVEAAPPVVEAAPPAVEAAPPVVEAAPPVVEAAPPVVEEAPPVVEAAPPVVEEAPPVVEEAPPVVEAAPPVVEAAPPVVEEAPPVVEAAASQDDFLLSPGPVDDGVAEEVEPEAPAQTEPQPGLNLADESPEQEEDGTADEPQQATLLRGSVTEPAAALSVEKWAAVLDSVIGLGGKSGTAATVARRYIFDAVDGAVIRLISRQDDGDSVPRFMRDHKQALCASLEGPMGIPGLDLELRVAQVPEGALSPSEMARAKLAEAEAIRRNTLGQHPLVRELVRNLGARIVLMNTDLRVLSPSEPQLAL